MTLQNPGDGHIPPPYPPDAADRLLTLWKQAIAAQNYPRGSDQHVTEAQEAALRRFFPSPSKLLFLGCGDGSEVKVAKNLGHDAWGATLNLGNVRYAAETLGLEHIFYLDAHILPPEWSESFDGVLGFQYLEHSPAPILMLLEVYRILRSGGWCWFETPGPEGWTMDDNPHHFTCPTAVQARGWLLKTDFRDVLAEEIGPPDAARHLGFGGRKP